MFSLVPKWPFVAGALVLGLAAGAYGDHKVMQGRIDKMTLAHTEELRVREVQRAKDEVAAREEERRLVLAAGKIEQEKNDEIAIIRTALDTAIAGLQNRPDRKPAGAGGVPTPRPACQGATGAELSKQDGGFLSGEAARAEELRAALSACYAAHDSVSAPSPAP